MKVILDIKDNKVDFVMEMLKNFSFIKATPITTEKSQLIASIKEAVKELNLIKAGKLKGIPAEDLFNDL